MQEKLLRIHARAIELQKQAEEELSKMLNDADIPSSGGKVSISIHHIPQTFMPNNSRLINSDHGSYLNYQKNELDNVNIYSIHS